MANLWITGDSWGVLDKDAPDSHWVNYYKQHYKLENIYCLARQGISQDMINYITSCVVKNIKWEGRKEKWQNYDDHLIVFPTTPTRLTFKRFWDHDNFDPEQGPHNLNWQADAHPQVQEHPWYTNDKLATLESENFTSLQMDDNQNSETLKQFSLLHPEKFCEWRDNNHLHHIIREVQTCKIYGKSIPFFHEWFPDIASFKAPKEQVNHLDDKRHYMYWKELNKIL